MLLTGASVFVVVVDVFFARGLAVFALALVSVFFGAAVFLVVVAAFVAVFFGAAVFFVAAAFGLTSFSAFGLASVFFAAAGFFSAVVVVVAAGVFGAFFASLTGPEGPVCVSDGLWLTVIESTYLLAARTRRPSHLA